MFTHKQEWRRARSNLSLRKKCSQILYEQESTQPEFRRAFSDSAVRKLDNVTCPRIRRVTEGDLTSSTNGSKLGRATSVRFSEENRVVLVPSRNEYIKRGLNKDVWYDSNDYAGFQLSAKAEIMDFLQQDGGTVKGAINFLYQATDESNSAPISESAPHPSPTATTTSIKRDFRRMGSDTSNASVDSQGSTGAVESPIDALSLACHTDAAFSRITQVSVSNERRNMVHPLALLV